MNKPPNTLITEIGGDLADAASTAKLIRHFVNLLGVVLAGGDAESVIDDMHAVVLEARDLAKTLETILERASEAQRQLANP